MIHSNVPPVLANLRRDLCTPITDTSLLVGQVLELTPLGFDDPVDLGSTAELLYRYEVREILLDSTNWAEVVKALQEVGYDSYLTAEISPYRFYPTKLAYDTLVSLDVLLGKPVGG